MTENKITGGNSADQERMETKKNLLSPQDCHLFNEGSHFRLYEKLGAHPVSCSGQEGVHFAVWAPNAAKVSLIGSFNGWDKEAHPLAPHGDSGIWTGFVDGIGTGVAYKYHITSRYQAYRVDKADPFAFFAEHPPRTASVVQDLSYEWSDKAWMQERRRANGREAPISIYEMHAGSWMRVPEENNRFLNWREMAPKLVAYLLKMGFTHVEFLPVMEHPFYASWGYQCLGYFAPTCRYGSPQDFMFLIDQLHLNGIGVILDWVPSHFPSDEHGLGYFDGTCLFEHADRRQGVHPDWGSIIFNYGRNEVRSFLISSALFWLDKYHVDGFRVDAVASMLYLDYSRRPGKWVPNAFGGRENLDAIAFLRRFNQAVHQHYPQALTIAEESTAWPQVSRPTHLGGLGFDFKWDMGWMHDTLDYMSHDPIHRSFHHHQLTFRRIYAFQENYVLPLSHDEVVHGKGSLFSRMPGDTWRRFANLRLMFGCLYAQPGKKLLFMGGEFGQQREWCHDASLDWHLLDDARHRQLQRWLEDLNRFYRRHPAMHSRDNRPEGFEWIDCHDAGQSCLTLLRFGTPPAPPVMAACNFTPVPRYNYRVGVPGESVWSEKLNSDSRHYGGSNQGNQGKLEATPVPYHGFDASLNLTLPPLAMVFFLRESDSHAYSDADQ